MSNKGSQRKRRAIADRDQKFIARSLQERELHRGLLRAMNQCRADLAEAIGYLASAYQLNNSFIRGNVGQQIRDLLFLISELEDRARNAGVTWEPSPTLAELTDLTNVKLEGANG